jgi:hypothetical protein
MITRQSACHVLCEKGRRDGRYILAGLIEKRGGDAKLIDWLDELTAECPKKMALNMNDPCGVRCRKPISTDLPLRTTSSAFASLDHSHWSRRWGGTG